jgi:long-chain acyl-CoA synthetase
MGLNAKHWEMIMIETMGDLIRVRAGERPDKPAIIAGDTTLSYAELDAESSQVAQGLLAAGIGPQDRVAFFGRNSAEFFTLLFGAAKVNAVVVAVNWRLAPPEVAYIVNDAQAKLLLVDEEFSDFLPKMSLEAPPLVVINGASDAQQTYRGWVDPLEAIDPEAPAANDDTCVQLYTSGTTGFPKGVEISNDNLFGMMSTILNPWDFDENSVNLVVMPVFHIAGGGWGLVGLFAGGTNIVLSDFDPGQLLEIIPEHGVTNALFVPAILQFLLIMPQLGDTDFSSLRNIVYGASPISEDVLVGAMTAMDTKFCQVYGLTETTGVVVQLDAEDHDPGGPKAHLLRAAGKPLPGVEFRVVDYDGNDVAAGEVGELWTRSTQNMKGYWGNAEATAAAFPEGRDETGLGWFRTGDAGYIEDGYIFIHDRVKDMIISGGENIYPAEIENVLMSHEAVSDAAVIGVPDDQWGEAVKAIVVVADEVDDKELLDFCRERLAGFKCPRSIDHVEALPRNPSGKILKTELRAPYWEGRERRVN